MAGRCCRTGTAVLTCLSCSLIAAAAGDDPALPVKVPPNHPGLRYVGRFDSRDKSGPRCAWSACSVEIRFKGTAANVLLRDAGR